MARFFSFVSCPSLIFSFFYFCFPCLTYYSSSFLDFSSFLLIFISSSFLPFFFFFKLLFLSVVCVCICVFFFLFNCFSYLIDPKCIDPNHNTKNFFFPLLFFFFCFFFFFISLSTFVKTTLNTIKTFSFFIQKKKGQRSE